MRLSVPPTLAGLLLALVPPQPLVSQREPAGSAMAGISSQGHDGDQPYVTAGDRAYLIGSQDGGFPDMGTHVPGEMAGLWIHPIKLADGFWATVRDASTGREVALTRADRLVTYPFGTRLRYDAPLDGLEIERFQFSPDGHPGVVIQYQLTNASDRAKRVDLSFAVRTDLSPVWYSEKIGITDAPDSVTWRAGDRTFIGRDTGHSWFVVWGAPETRDAGPIAGTNVPRTTGSGAAAAARYPVSVGPGRTATLRFVFAGSASGEADALRTYRYLAANHATLLERKRQRYAALLDRARVTIPDKRLQAVYDWVRVNMEWLVREVPGTGRGLGAGLMEYPWWFGTETYSLQALMATGDIQLPQRTLGLLKRYSDSTNGNGRIVHEVTTAGAISNPGNSQETAQFILTLGRLLDWSGDLEFAREMYPAMKQGLRWLLADMDRDGNMFPGGYGIMEVLGLNAELIDVSVYTQHALEATARVARALGEADTAAHYARLASELKERINRRFWIEQEGSYADFYGTRAQAVSAAEGARKQLGLKGEDRLTPRERELMQDYTRLARSFAAMPDTTRGWLTNKNWVIATPMETAIAPRERALRALDKIRRENVGPHGPYLSAVERLYMMTIATGVQAVAEANYGRTEEALWYMDRIAETFNRVTPGSISEMMPDGGCFTIAWTSYGIVVPLVQHIFGIQPDAVRKTVTFTPHMPEGWADMRIDDLPVGANVVSLAAARTGKGVEYTIESRDSAWTLVLRPAESAGARYYLNGRPVFPSPSGIRMTGARNHVVVAR
jgi:glycogen debranching enzyme